MMSGARPTMLRTLGAGAVLAILLACGGERPATLVLEVSAEADVGPVTRLQALARMTISGDDIVWGAGTHEFAGRDLATAPWELAVSTPEGASLGGEATLVVLGSRDSAVVGMAWLRIDLGATEPTAVTLVAIPPGCDRDHDGFLDCEKTGCCTPDWPDDLADCDDRDDRANPFADSRACRDCSPGCDATEVKVEFDLPRDIVDETPADEAGPIPDDNLPLDVRTDDDGAGETDAPPAPDDAPELDAFPDPGAEALPEGDEAVGGEAEVPDESQADVCQPTCGAAACGDDGCGGSCGDCAPGKACLAGACSCPDECGPYGARECTDDTHVRTCGDPDTDTCLEWSPSQPCEAGTVCRDGACTCEPSCAGLECGDDGCGGGCGECAVGMGCLAGACVCTPACDDRVCGDDGCGGSCGECAGDEACVGGACVCVDECGPNGLRECLDDARFRTCADTDDDSCLEWTTGSNCSEGTICREGRCDCVPSCQGRACGDDGCGSSCGACANGAECVDGACVCRGFVDDDCDGLDGDCDGLVDEEFVGTPTACGSGECRATGVLVCVGGATSDTCTAGLPATDDASCNGLDDDCDGTTDEAYVVTATACGIGACAATGKRSCVGGVELDSCVPSLPAPDDTWCNGADDDCDGATDDAAVCDDGNLCNGVSTCVNGGCVESATPVACHRLDECHDVGVCDPTTGTCSSPTGNEGQLCDDDEDRCNGISICVAGACTETVPAVACVAQDECHVTGACDPTNGECSVPVGNEGMPCDDDGDACNGEWTCQAGSCVESTPPVTCGATDPCHLDGTCDPATGVCSRPAGHDGALCDDDDLCNGVSRCVAGACTPKAPPVTCAPPDACHELGRCEPASGECAYPLRPDGAFCNDDGNPCNGGSTCVAGACQPTIAAVTCVAYDECHVPGTCNPATGLCSNPSGNEGAACGDDGDECNGSSSCVAGACTLTVAPVTCEASDACHVTGSCNPLTGLCSNPPRANGEVCNDDGNRCNGVSTCLAGACTSTTPTVTCTALDACHAVGTCDPTTGLCSNPAGNEGSVCNDDGNKCNGISTCAAGLCKQTVAPVTCTAQDACHLAGSCAAATGVCSNPSKTCADADVCTVDSCNPATGCAFVTRDCNDGKPGTIDSCDAETGGCRHVSSVTPGFVEIPAGSFWMGSPQGQLCPDGYTGGGCPTSGLASTELGRESFEILHFVTLTRAIEIQARETTQADWLATFPGWNPSGFVGCGGACPVEQVSWYDALAYANTRSIEAGKPACYGLTSIVCHDGTSVAAAADCMTGARGGIDSAQATLNGLTTAYACAGYRLPTESEWEYAYRAGSNTAFYPTAGNDGTITQIAAADPNADKIAWYYYNSYMSTWPVGTKTPNAWGLSDMPGNVWEWCWDFAGSYPNNDVSSPAVDPIGPTTGTFHVMRGGSLFLPAAFLRAAIRNSSVPETRRNYLGFRLVRTLP